MLNLPPHVSPMGGQTRAEVSQGQRQGGTGTAGFISRPWRLPAAGLDGVGVSRTLAGGTDEILCRALWDGGGVWGGAVSQRQSPVVDGACAHPDSLRSRHLFYILKSGDKLYVT